MTLWVGVYQGGGHSYSGIKGILILASHSMSPTLSSWRLLAVCKMRYKIFNLPCNFTKSCDRGSCNFMNGNSSLYITPPPYQFWWP